MAEFSSLKETHEPGIIGICTDPAYPENDEDSGEVFYNILTGGSEGEIRAWRAIDGDIKDEEPEHYKVSSTITAFAWKESKLWIGDENNHVQEMNWPDCESESVVVRSTTPITKIIFNKDLSHVLVGCSDFTVKWVDRKTCSYITFEGHTAPVLSVALHKDELIFASSSADGTVKIWSLDPDLNADNRIIHTIPTLFPKTNDISPNRTLADIKWHPENADELIIPIKNAIAVFDRDTWIEKFKLTLESNKNTHEFSLLAFSTDNKYLASASLQGIFAVWDWGKRYVLWSGRHNQSPNIVPTALAWHPNPSYSNTLVFTENEGRIGTIKNVLYATVEKEMKAAMEVGQNVDDEEDDAPVKSGKKANRLPDIEDEFSRGSDGGIEAIKRQYGFGSDQLEAAGNLNEGGTSVDNLDQAGITSPIAGGPGIQSAMLQSASWKPLKPHPTFVSSATPSASERYLKWNEIGIVKAFDPEDEGGTIEVEFLDSTIHHGITIDNSSPEYSMADLNRSALALAASSEPGLRSRIFVNNFSSWDQESREWSCELPKRENATAICMGKNWVALATDRRYIRVWSLGGIQRYIWSVPGKIVNICGHESELAVVSQSNMSAYGATEHSLQLSIHRISTEGRLPKFAGVSSMMKSSVESVAIALSPPKMLAGLDADDNEEDEDDNDLSEPTILVWTGFTDRGNYCTVDSCGMVRLYHRGGMGGNNCWIPMCDLNAHATKSSDNYWVIRVMEGECKKPQIRAIMCKGSRYPYFLPRPIVNTIEWSLPVCEIGSGHGELEQSLALRRLLSELFVRDLSGKSREDLEFDPQFLDMRKEENGYLLKLFVMAAKSNQVRAVELGELMPNSKGVQALIRGATKLKKNNLAERLGQVALAKDEMERNQNNAFDEAKRELEERRQAFLQQKEKENESLNRLDDGPSIRPNVVLKVKTKRDSSVMPIAASAESSTTFDTSADLFNETASPKLNPTKINPFKRKESEITASLDDSSRSATDVFDSLTPTSKKLKSTTSSSSNPFARK